MANRAPAVKTRAGLCLLAIACWAMAGPALAGDEDLSPNAYQEFDPVTGFMVPVDPDARSEHGQETAAQAEHEGAPVAEDATTAGDPGPAAWVYWVIVGIAAIGVVAWLRKKATTLAD